MTKRAYYENGALECEATVLRCRAVENGFEILTDVTSIFPESGGQLSDTGFIGNSRVTHAREEGSEVWHLCDKAVEAGKGKDSRRCRAPPGPHTAAQRRTYTFRHGK